MSPSTSADSLEAAAKSLKDLVQKLYEISLSIYAFNSQNSADILVNQVVALTSTFNEVDKVAEAVKDVQIPREVIGYIEHGRNPDIYTREFVEIAVKQNQFLNGKQRAFQEFRDVLAEQINISFPELQQDVEAVLRSTNPASGVGEGGEGGERLLLENGSLEPNGEALVSQRGGDATQNSFVSSTTEPNGSGVF